MPGVIAALNRINEVYGEGQRERSCGGISQMEDGSIRFDSVSFAYVPGEPVLRDVSFQAGKDLDWRSVGGCIFRRCLSWFLLLYTADKSDSGGYDKKQCYPV